VPQLGLQQTNPVLQVAIPHVALNGYTMGLPHCFPESHSSPGRMQIPQLLLQHSSPTLQVFEPQEELAAKVDMPHTCCEHISPGSAQVPQLALQHTSRSGHWTFPHCNLITAGAGATRSGNGSANVASPAVSAIGALFELEGTGSGAFNALGDNFGILAWLDAIGVALAIATDGWLNKTQVFRLRFSSRLVGAA
jgi:hypothetical protein